MTASPDSPRRPDLGEPKIGDQTFVAFSSYQDVKKILRDYGTFMSATPFRVPIPSEEDLRPTPQLPIESDPPEHTEYRGLMDRHFSRSAAAAKRGDTVLNADVLLDEAVAGGNCELVTEFALPLFLRALALTLGLPQWHVPRWLTWGIQALASQSTPGRPGNVDMNAFIDEVVDSAMTDPGDDFFGHLAKSEVRGRQLTRDELRGFGNLAFAGGRQTTVYALTSAIYHLAEHPQDAEYLRTHPDEIARAIEEFLRWATPIVHLGRTVTEEAEVGGVRLRPGELVSVCYAGANRDPSVFEDADEVKLNRKPNRHVAFGHGPHTCVGAPLARMVLSVGLIRFLARTRSFELAAEPVEHIEHLAGVDYRVGFDRLELNLVAA